MKTLKNILWSVALACALPFIQGCEKEPQEPELQLAAPVVKATLNGLDVEVKWDPVVNATSYKVEYKKAADAEFAAAGTVNYSPYVAEGLELNNTYDFRVKALSGEVESPWSNVVSVEVVNLLSVPELTLSPSITYIDVKWEAVEGVETYRVEYKETTAAEYTEAYSGTGEDVEYAVKIVNLKDETSYDIRVACLAEGYTETFTDVYTVMTTAAPSTLIKSADEFIAWLKNIDGVNEETAALACDIDMTGKTIESATGFAGTLEGQGYAIKNLVSDKPIFAENSGTIKDLVIDASCSFTASTNVFGALATMSKGGSYKKVSNRANVTYTATADVEQEIILGGLVGVSEGGKYDECSNSGAIKFEAPGLNHKAASLGGLVGLVDVQQGKAEFLACANRGEISLNAKCGEPLNDFTYGGNGNGRGNNIGGICGTACWGEAISVFDQCINETDGKLTFYHSDMSGLETSTSGTGPVSVAGILGMGQGNFNKCRNYALISVKSLVTGEPSEASLKRRNYMLYVGGIAGCGWDYMEIASCTNSGNIEVEHYGLYDGDDRWRSGVGGICAYGVHNDPGTYANYCKNEGDITVTGKGTTAVGGIFGYRGKQIKNKVTADCTITVNGRKGDVGGLAGYLSGGADNVAISGCECYATIFADSDWGPFDKDWYVTIGGLVGRWGGMSNGSSNAALKNRDGDPCVFGGSVSTTYQKGRVGAVVGYVTGGTNQFGEKDNPIKVSGTIQMEDLVQTTITSENVETYSLGATKGTTTMYVTCGNN